MAITITRDDVKRRLRLPAGAVSCVMVNAGDTISAVLHGRVAGDVITFSATTGGVVVGTLYYVINVTTADVFQISATRGGAAFTLNADGANTFSVRTVYDADLDNLITELQAGLTGMIDTAAIGTYEAACKAGMIDVIAGEALNMLRRQPGYADAITVGGVALGAEVESGDKLITMGLAILAPFTIDGYQDLTLKKAEVALGVAYAQARDDWATATATAEKDKVVADAAKVESEKLKLDAETTRIGSEKILVDAQADTEAQKPVKVLADAAMSTAMAADAQARADMNAARKARMAVEDAALAVDLPLESHDCPSDSRFDLDSGEYSNGNGF